MPEFFVADELARKELKVVLPAWRSTPVPVYALHRVALRGEQRVRALIEHLRTALATFDATA